jgi:hypothetical protein
MECYALGEDPRQVRIKSDSGEESYGVEMFDDDQFMIDGIKMNIRRE